MRRFARAGNRVIFVNSISLGLPSLAHKDLLPRIARKLRSYARYSRVTEEGIVVVSPPTLPFFGSTISRSINRVVLSRQIQRLARQHGLKYPILWIAIPTAVEMIGRFDESLVIYQVSDKYDANTMDHATDPLEIRRLHERALAAADIVFYSGRKLLAEAESGRERSYLLEQAVDFEHWARAGNGSLKVPPAMAAIPQPRLGYFGTIDPWLMDNELIRLAARLHPQWHWVFIGNRARGVDFENLPTVHFLPPVTYEELPSYAAGFDVCVLPWDVENVWTSYGSAIKVREYLATGKPVVISPLPEYEAMKDVLRIGRSREEFLALVDDALSEKDETAKSMRKAAVADGTWDVRAELVSGLIEEALAKQSL
ncbi:MAG TPA: glycosyltransferase [Pyrinomonadaceae bacterium]|nr:glycosyltransferase [Pyrinomonadaceae bacterium]